MKRPANSPTQMKLTWLAAKAAGSVSSTLAGPIAARLWFTPWRVPIGERARAKQAELLADAERFTIPADGMDLAAFGMGTGPTILLVHGWGDNAATFSAFVRPLAAAGYRVVGIDLPGHGESPGGQTDAFKLGRAIREASETLGPITAAIAHSVGALTTAYAAHEGLETDALVFLSPAVRLESSLTRFSELVALPPKAIKGLRSTIERRYGPGVWSEFATDRLGQDLDIPTLIVHDLDDDQVRIEDARLLAAEWRYASLVETEGLGHARILRDDKVIERVVSFVNERRAVAGRPARQAMHLVS